MNGNCLANLLFLLAVSFIVLIFSKMPIILLLIIISIALFMITRK